MKILYLITKSNWGGAQRYVYDLAVAFSKKGHSVSVAAGGNGELMARLQEASIETHTLGSLKRDIALLHEWRSFKETYDLIKHECPDVLHLNSSKAAGIGAFIGRMLGVPNIVVTLHGAPFREDRPFLIKRAIYFFTWLTCLLAHHVITVSKQDEYDIAKMQGVRRKVKTIYLGLPFDGLKERTTPKGKTIHVVTIAELHRNKGLIYALQAVDSLHKKGIDIKYSIFGEGEERPHLEHFIREHGLENIVTLHGHVRGVSESLHEFDVFLLPSVKEGLPYVLLEAGKAMLPVITTTTGGIPEIVRHEETGLLVTPKNPELLANELLRFVQDRNFGKRMGKGLHSHIISNFGFSKMIVETASVYGLIETKK